MATFEVIVEEEIIGIQHRAVIIDADNEDEAVEKVKEGEGKTVDCWDVDTYGATGSSCDLVSVKEI